DAVYSFFIPFLIFALPLFDTALSFVRRVLHKQSPFEADRKHLHHRLLEFGFKQKEVVIFLLSFSSMLSISAIMFSLGEYVTAAIIAVTAIVILCLIFILFRRKTVNDFLKPREDSVEEEKKDENQNQ
ncbi:MAG: undecaprenyl/decaprenyl-phosphate alpha-N-acetylglucosaminyl 1-phosphate transferase, partial [Clostridia bacterium]|nr:undecaprenyl/decaprenyl-phosphate alpha-N-acetylglucosaminyl 1-phosphate transferase [Clostridia bacterium]